MYKTCDICHVSSESVGLISRELDADPLWACDPCLSALTAENETNHHLVDSVVAPTQYAYQKCDGCQKVCDLVYGMGCPPGWPGGGDVLVYCVKCFDKNEAS